jgi:transcriptional regulator with XRE-family HTH domain
MNTPSRPGARRPRKLKKGHYMHVISHKRLALLAKEKGYGPVRLARHAGHENHSYMSRMLKGDPRARSVTLRTATRVADALGVPVELLFEERAVKSADSTEGTAA